MSHHTIQIFDFLLCTSRPLVGLSAVPGSRAGAGPVRKRGRPNWPGGETVCLLLSIKLLSRTSDSLQRTWRHFNVSPMEKQLFTRSNCAAFSPEGPTENITHLRLFNPTFEIQCLLLQPSGPTGTASYKGRSKMPDEKCHGRVCCTSLNQTMLTEHKSQVRQFAAA